MPAVMVEGIAKSFGRVKAVDGVSFEVEEGEILTLLGPSGCGKTTSLRIVAGLEQADQGEVSIGGRLVTSPRKRVQVPAEKRGIGMVFQSYAVWPHMTVFQNVAYPLQLRRTPRAEVREKVYAILAMMGLKGLEERPSTLLSGGQQQRVALGRALVFDPRVLLLDEPLSNLDAKLREQMRFELKDIQRRAGVSFLFVTHDQAEAMVLSDRIAVMKQGRIVQMGTPREVFERPKDRFVIDFVGIVSDIPCEVVEVKDGLCLLKAVQAEGLLSCPAPDNIRVGTSVSVCARPRSMILHEVETVRPNLWRGTVTRASYVGTRTEYFVQVGQQMLRVFGLPSQQLNPGDEVYVELNAEGLVLFPADGA